MRLLLLATLIWASTASAQAPPGALSRAPVIDPQTASEFLALVNRARVPLSASLDTLTDVDGLAHEHISFAAEAGERIPTLLVRPRGRSGRRPVIIALHGTGSSKNNIAGRLRPFAHQGFIAVAIDGRYHGERTRPVPGPSTPYTNAILRTYQTGKERPFLYDTVWDAMRLIDYLQTRPDVDSTRIGLMGFSKGGMETYLTAAVDSRVAVAVPIIGVQSFRWALDHAAWDSRAWTFRGAVDSAARESGQPVTAQFMRQFYDRVAPGIYGNFDGPAMLPLIAPRPLLVINGDSDARTPIGGVRECAAAAQEAYRKAGASDKFELFIQPDAGHEVTPAADERTMQWFIRWLEPSR